MNMLKQAKIWAKKKLTELGIGSFVEAKALMGMAGEHPFPYGSVGKQEQKGKDRTRYGETKAQSKRRAKNRKRRKLYGK